MCGAPIRRTPPGRRSVRRRSARPRPNGTSVRVEVSTRNDPKGLRPWSGGGFGLAGLAVQRVPAVPAAVLLHLDPLAVVDLGFDRDVVAPLALFAGQRDLDSLVILRHVLAC